MNSPEVNSNCLNDPAYTCILKYSDQKVIDDVELFFNKIMAVGGLLPN